MYISTTISQPWRPLLKVLGKSLAGLALATSILGYGFSGIPALAVDGSTGVTASILSRDVVRALHTSSSSMALQDLPLQSAESLHTQSNLSFLEDGTYLYGQSDEPNQVGTAYMVFEVAADNIVGAFYMPSSSFDCFQGTIEAHELALDIHDSYAQESYPYSIALVTNEGAIASQEPVLDSRLNIDGFRPIEAVSGNDQRMLATCRTNLW